MCQAIIIPTLNPSHKLITLIDELTRMGANSIIVVNDGSGVAHLTVFEELKNFTQVTVLTHSINRGKGQALKSAFTYCMENLNGLTCVITADDDGQHAPEDIMRIAKAMADSPDSFVMGVRLFTKDETPVRSYIGNTTVNFFLRLLYGLRLTDSQTGLRGIPVNALPWVTALQGSHYEFEIHMLIEAARRKIPIQEIPIQLLYFDNNRASHYKTVRDTFRITGLLISGLFHRSNPYGRLFCFTRFVLRLSHRRLSAPEDTRTESTVYIARHRNLKGVLDIVLWYKKPFRIWVLDVFYDRKRCFNHYAHYTLTERLGWPRLLAYPAAFLFSLYVAPLMHSMKSIPVYRKSIRQMRITLDRSVETLCAGESLVLFPDVDYASESDSMGEMYAGFVNLDKPYYQKTKKHLDFIPLIVNETEKRIEMGTSVCIQDGEPFPSGKKRVCAEIYAQLNR